jgi:hypothetical protein
MKQTWYVVQTSPRVVVEQAQALMLTEARRAWKAARAAGVEKDGFGRRFPRIIKITQESKTIKEG